MFDMIKLEQWDYQKLKLRKRECQRVHKQNGHSAKNRISNVGRIVHRFRHNCVAKCINRWLYTLCTVILTVLRAMTAEHLHRWNLQTWSYRFGLSLSEFKQQAPEDETYY